MKRITVFLAIFNICSLEAQQLVANANKDSIAIVCNYCDSLYNLICPDNIYFAGHPDPPEFAGGDKCLMEFINNNIKYPEDCIRDSIQGIVICKFIIDDSGNIICPIIRKSVHPSLDREVLRVISIMPKWKPASLHGVPCKQCFGFPIRFNLDKPAKSKSNTGKKKFLFF
ncbi:MAG: energy transducer TonB [Dysgonamonadaceae bacterium]|jgi:TonB family protein|nr:energy transducer TonB [Dysgonamonadaceae bacterium]